MLSPSSAHRWMECPGSLAWPENTAPSPSSVYADEGTAAHTLAQRALTHQKPCEFFLGVEIQPHPTSKVFTVDEEMAEHVQVYVDEVLRRATGCHLYVEHRVDLQPVLGEGQFGTADAVIVDPCGWGVLTVIDLKYGKGERVSAEENKQLMLYALGALNEFSLLYDLGIVRLIIAQPRVAREPQVWELSAEDLRAFGKRAAEQGALAHRALTLEPTSDEALALMHASEKACRWCRVAGGCPVQAAAVQEAVGADFNVIAATPPRVETTQEALSVSYAAVPFVLDWCKAVVAHTERTVREGGRVIGSDGHPLKIVEGKKGNREWKDEAAAEAALVAQLGPKAYKPQEIITASKAAEKLDKKKTEKLWNDIFVPLIERKDGKPVLALGSDPRPPWTGAADETEFEDTMLD